MLISSDVIVAFRNESVSTGSIGSSCSRFGLSEVLTLARAATSQLKPDLTLATFSANVSPRDDITVTDDPIAVTDLEPFTFTAAPQASTCAK